jgi:hypothetical protein
MPANLTWNDNPSSTTLPAINVGSQVMLQADGVYGKYSVKAEVLELGKDDIRAKVIAIFDRGSSAQVHGGTEIQQLNASEINFQRRKVFNVFTHA